MKTALAALDPHRPRQPRHFATALWLALGLAGAAAAQPAPPAPARQQQLLRMLEQDCGSCHGLRMTGGLGPDLRPARMREIPRDSLAATIYLGRPGTPMPPWRSMISAEEADWLAGRLRQDPDTATPKP